MGEQTASSLSFALKTVSNCDVIFLVEKSRAVCCVLPVRAKTESLFLLIMASTKPAAHGFATQILTYSNPSQIFDCLHSIQTVETAIKLSDMLITA